MRTASLEVVDPAARALTLDEWAALPEDDVDELVENRLVDAEVPDQVHETVVTWLVVALDPWARARDGRVYPSGVKLAVSPSRGRLPDVSVFLGGRRPPARGVVHLPPDIAVEVVSTAPADIRRDRIEKFGEYAGFGVHFYWLVDPQLRSLEVWELVDGRYVRSGVAGAGKVDDVPGCDGLVLDLDDLWARIDELSE